MRAPRLSVVGLLVAAAACGGGDDAASTTLVSTTDVQSPPDGGDVFSESDDSTDGGADAEPGGDDGEPEVDSTTTTSVAPPSAGGDDEGEQEASTTGGDSDGTTGSAASSDGGDGATGSDDGGESTTGAGSTDGGDTTDGSGSADTTSTGGDGEPDPDLPSAADLDPGILLDAGELAEAGLGDSWEGESVVEFGGVDDEAPCGLDAILAVDQLLGEYDDADGNEIEQVVALGVGGVGVGAVAGFSTCDDFLAEFEDGAAALSVAPPAGASSASGTRITTGFDDEVLTWLAADVDGAFVGIFHVGPTSQQPGLDAAFVRLVADAAAGLG